MINGLIAIWSGAIADIPAGWHLCDGNSGTPDLRNRFVIGAGATYNPGDTGGTATHDHSFTGDGHTHHISPGTGIAAGANYDDETDPGNATGNTDSAPSLPFYFALAYIMKL